MSEALTPVIYNVTITSADTEYSQALPGSCKFFTVQCRTAADLRMAFVAGKVAASTAPYATVKSGTVYSSPQRMESPPTPITVYLANAAGSVAAEIIAWY